MLQKSLALRNHLKTCLKLWTKGVIVKTRKEANFDKLKFIYPCKYILEIFNIWLYLKNKII